MISASAGVYQRVSAAKRLPADRFARGKEDVGAERGLEMVLLRQSVDVVGSSTTCFIFACSAGPSC